MADIDSNKKKTSKIPGILAILAIILLIVGAVIYYLPSSSLFSSNSKTTNTAKTASPTETKPAASTQPAAQEDIGPYKGWGKFENKTWGLSARCPIGWTINEAAGNSVVIFAGPAMPAGSVVLNECTFSISVETISSAIGLEAYVTAARSTPQGAGDITKQIDTTLDSNIAIQIVDTYADVGQPWKRVRTWTIKNEKAYTFTYIASPNLNKIDYYSPHEQEAEQIMESILIK